MAGSIAGRAPGSGAHARQSIARRRGGRRAPRAACRVGAGRRVRRCAARGEAWRSPRWIRCARAVTRRRECVRRFNAGVRRRGAHHVRPGRRESGARPGPSSRTSRWPLAPAVPIAPEAASSVMQDLLRGRGGGGQRFVSTPSLPGRAIVARRRKVAKQSGHVKGARPVGRCVATIDCVGRTAHEPPQRMQRSAALPEAQSGSAEWKQDKVARPAQERSAPRRGRRSAAHTMTSVRASQSCSSPRWARSARRSYRSSSSASRAETTPSGRSSSMTGR